jgi:hypothetical protein
MVAKFQISKIWLVGACLAFLCDAAYATGGFGCEIDDENLKLVASAGLGRGMGSPMLNFTGEAEIRLKETPKSFVKVPLTPSLVHHWIEGNDLWLHFYAETTGDNPFASAEIVLRASGGDDAEDYAGSYRLSVFSNEPPLDKEGGRTLSAEGKVTCMVE